MNNTKVRAFLLDSSFDWAAMVKQTLHHHQIELVEWNRTGHGWAEAFKTQKPNLVILDFLLTRRDAMNCLSLLAGLSIKPYIIFTHTFCGVQANLLEQRAIAMGASTVLQKPYTEQKLNVLLERAIAEINS